MKVAQSNEKLAEAAMAEAEAVLARTQIYAPSSGTIVKKLVEEGELVAPGSPLVQLINMQELRLTIYISGKDIGRVKLGQAADVYIDSFPDKAFAGKVISVAQEAEFTPKNVHMQDERVKLVYAVDIGLNNSTGAIKPGMPADAIIRWDDEEK